MRLEQTALNFLLRHQELHKRSYNFLILMEAIMTAAKYIQYYYQTGALSGNLGKAGTTNVQNEEVMQMDDLANSIVLKYLRWSGQVIHAVSEEEVEYVPMEDETTGRYFVYFDPLDGSSNVKHGLPVGFLFGIGKKTTKQDEDFHLRKGNEYIAAGMFVIPTGVFTLALHDAGTYRFFLDETMTYVHPQRIGLPIEKKKWELSFNTANKKYFRKSVQEWIHENESNYSFRYIGALAADFHRLLSNGGMFMYPAIVNHPKKEKNRPMGKLRLLYEASVVAFMAKEAGGVAIDENGDNILNINPFSRHQRTALYIGSRAVVEDIQKVLKKEAKTNPPAKMNR